MATVTPKGASVEQANGSAPITEAIENKGKAVAEAAAKTENMLVVWLRKLPRASLGLVAVVGDETKVFVNKLFMDKLVERGEVGPGVGGGLQLAGEQEGLLHEQGWEGCVGVVGRALGHGASSRVRVPSTYGQQTKTTRNYSRTRPRPGALGRGGA